MHSHFREHEALGRADPWPWCGHEGGGREAAAPPQSPKWRVISSTLGLQAGRGWDEAAQPSRPPPSQAPATPGGPSAWHEEMPDTPCSPHSISDLCWTHALCQGPSPAPRTLQRSGPAPGPAFLGLWEDGHCVESIPSASLGHPQGGSGATERTAHHGAGPCTLPLRATPPPTAPDPCDPLRDQAAHSACPPLTRPTDSGVHGFLAAKGTLLNPVQRHFPQDGPDWRAGGCWDHPAAEGRLGRAGRAPGGGGPSRTF